MSIIPITSLLLGSFTGIGAYKQQPVDYKLLAIYFGIITPIQSIKIYSNLDIVSKIKLGAVKPYIYFPMMLSILNGSVFGLGYIVGKTGYYALH
jgi:hypothetical protein